MSEDRTVENSTQNQQLRVDCALGAEQEEAIRCCPQCNYAMTKLRINQSRYNYPCPQCDTARISDFYALGSRKHQDILEGAALQMAPRSRWIPPLPMPKESP